MALDQCKGDNPPKPCAQEGMLRRIPLKNMEVPRLRAETLQRAGTGFARWAPSNKKQREKGLCFSYQTQFSLGPF